jgi:hypothetical protein
MIPTGWHMLPELAAVEVAAAAAVAAAVAETCTYPM